MSVGDLVIDEYAEKGVVTGVENYKHNGYVEVTFFGGLYGSIICEVNHKFLTIMSKRKK